MRIWIASLIAVFFGFPALAQPPVEGPPLCTVKAITRVLPDGFRYEVDLERQEAGRALPLQRAKTLEEAIHFVLAERRHGTCRPAFPQERPSCVFSMQGRQFLMSYAKAGERPKPVALFVDSVHARITLRQMRDVFLCN